MIRVVGRGLFYTVLAGATVLVLFVLGAAMLARLQHPELRAWHRMALSEEFKQGRPGAPKSFEEYKKLEDRLFAELGRRLSDDPLAQDSLALGRYDPQSEPYRLALKTQYNRSYELIPAEPRGVVLLVHGLSDSPYIMHSIADGFFKLGYRVLVLRLPGHGTVPAGLVDVAWQDWYAAVVLAARYAAKQSGPGRPFLAGGFSTGAALLTLYSIKSLDDTTLPPPEQLYLLSPAIGITKLAVLSNLMSALSFIPWFEKSRWIDVLPEYDPYKYNSFPANAASQIHRLTLELERSLLSAKKRGLLRKMPRVTVFQSVVDATVETAEVVDGLLALLPNEANQLVIFDVNRQESLRGLLAPSPLLELRRLQEEPKLPFRLVVISNDGSNTAAVAAHTREAGSATETTIQLGLEWPRGVVSLGHLALPLPIDDPIYGLTPLAAPGPTFDLGAVDVRGEDGALLVPLGMLARIRCNPFYAVVWSTIEASLPPAPRGDAPAKR